MGIGLRIGLHIVGLRRLVVIGFCGGMWVLTDGIGRHHIPEATVFLGVALCTLRTTESICVGHGGCALYSLGTLDDWFRGDVSGIIGTLVTSVGPCKSVGRGLGSHETPRDTEIHRDTGHANAGFVMQHLRQSVWISSAPPMCHTGCSEDSHVA